jgi:tellurium resistance protein TerD
MGITLQKGGNLSLTKEAPGLTQASFGLGWDANPFNGHDFDLDASALLLGANGKVRSDKDFVFYNQLADVTSADGKTPDPQNASVVHQGDNLTGEGDGDDEVVKVRLDRLPLDVQTVVFAVSIHDAPQRGQSFGQVRNAFIRIVDEATGVEVARYDLTEDYSVETALVFAELYRNGGEWKFRAVGQGYADGLAGIARDFGVGI